MLRALVVARSVPGRSQTQTAALIEMQALFFPFPRMRGKVGMGAIRSDRAEDRLQHIICPEQYIVIPETHHLVTLRHEPGIALGVCSGFEMMATIYFDNQFGVHTSEIRNVDADWTLASKAHARYLMAAQVHPQAPFGVGHVPTQMSGEQFFFALSH